jgi:hypothetical protein
MMVTGEAFLMRKGAEGAIHKVYLNSQAKRTVTGQNSGQLYNKKHQRAS